jgi:hypothetical protein
MAASQPIAPITLSKISSGLLRNKVCVGPRAIVPQRAAHNLLHLGPVIRQEEETEGGEERGEKGREERREREG